MGWSRIFTILCSWIRKDLSEATACWWLNALPGGEGRNYIAIGLGRWGTADHWLGIPVSWDQVCQTRVFVEVGLRDLDVEPSQGSHFFHNLACFGNGYFTVSEKREQEWVDWEWLSRQTAFQKKEHVTHLRFDKPLVIKMNGHTRSGCICKPEIGEKPDPGTSG